MLIFRIIQYGFVFFYIYFVPIRPKVLNVKKKPIKMAQNMLNFGRKIKVYLFDSDYKFISQDCQRYLERTAKKRLSGIEQSSVL